MVLRESRLVYWRSQLLDAHPRNRLSHDPMNEIVEKYEAKLERLNEIIERKKKFLTEEDLEVLAQLKVLLTEVVTDLRAIRAFLKTP